MKEKAYEIARYTKYDGHQSALANMISKFFHYKTGSEASANEELAEELHKPVIKKFKKEESMRDLKTIFGQQI